MSARVTVPSRHGASQPEAERTTERLALRVPPGTTEALDALAEADGLTRSAVVAGLVQGAARGRGV